MKATTTKCVKFYIASFVVWGLDLRCKLCIKVTTNHSATKITFYKSLV